MPLPTMLDLSESSAIHPKKVTWGKEQNHGTSRETINLIHLLVEG